MSPRTVLLALISLACAPLARADNPPQDPPLPQVPDRIFKIADHGAAAGGAADNTKALQAAIDAAAAADGGIVDVPAGEFLCGPVHLASRVNLRLAAGATLKMLPIDRYPGGTINPDSFISGHGLHDIAITGQGTIDGQGSPWWPLAKTKKDARRPRMIVLSGCDRVLIEKVRLMNSPMFHIAISGHSSNVTVRGVTIRAPASTDPVNPSHNTDACDVSGTHVLVQDCDVSVGDDNFTCEGGTSDVRITHCTYGYGHGVSIGSPTAGGVSNITVEDCTFTNTEAGIRIKSDRDRGGIVQNLTYRNLRMTNVGIPILIYASYMAADRQYRDLKNLTPEIATSYPPKPLTDRTPVYRDITFSNITATAAPDQRAGLIWGLPEAPVSNVLLQNVNITADRPFGIYNARGVRLENCKIVTPAGENKLSIGSANVTVSQANAAKPGSPATTIGGVANRAADPTSTPPPGAGGQGAADRSPGDGALVVSPVGPYKTVQDAINAAHSGTTEHPTIIHVLPGTYKERLYVQREKRFIQLRGDDPAKTVITYDLYASQIGPDGKPVGTFGTASAFVDADDFSAENLTLENAAGPKGQALAIRIDGDRDTFRNCRFLGWQDTILDNRGRHYYDHCAVSGSVDFIFGGGTGVFDHCDITQIRDTGGVLTAPSTPKEQPYGLVFLHCRLLKAPGVRPASTTLMRPWREYGMSAFIDCAMDDAISPRGWSPWDGKEKTCRALEYGSTTLTGQPIDLTQRAPWAHVLTSAEAAQYTIPNLFHDWNPTPAG